jgi:hypothetical protein
MFPHEVIGSIQGVDTATKDSRELLLDDSPRNIIQECGSACQSFDPRTVEGITPTSDDVLMGRGKRYLCNPGNKLFNGTTKFSGVVALAYNVIPDPPRRNVCFTDLLVTNLDRYFETTDPVERKLIVREIMSCIFEKGRFLKAVNHAWSAVPTDESEKKVFQALKYLKRKADSVRTQRASHHNPHMGGLQSPEYSQRNFRPPHTAFSPRVPYHCHCCTLNGCGSGAGCICEECCDLYDNGTLTQFYGDSASRYMPCAASDDWTGHLQEHLAYSFADQSCRGFEATTSRPAMDAWAVIDYMPNEYPSPVPAKIGYPGGSGCLPVVPQREFLQHDTSLGQIDSTDLMVSFRDFEW